MNEQILKAIQAGNVIEFEYEGYVRIVEPHCFGVSMAGNDVLRAFQVAGGSESGKLGWKMLLVSKIRALKVVPIRFIKSRAGYNPRDRQMARIYAAYAS